MLGIGNYFEGRTGDLGGRFVKWDFVCNRHFDGFIRAVARFSLERGHSRGCHPPERIVSNLEVPKRFFSVKIGVTSSKNQPCYAYRLDTPWTNRFPTHENGKQLQTIVVKLSESKENK